MQGLADKQASTTRQNKLIFYQIVVRKSKSIHKEANMWSKSTLTGKESKTKKVWSFAFLSPFTRKEKAWSSASPSLCGSLQV